MCISYKYDYNFACFVSVLVSYDEAVLRSEGNTVYPTSDSVTRSIQQVGKFSSQRSSRTPKQTFTGVALTNLRYQQDQADDGSEKSTTNTHSRTKNLPRNKLIAEKRKASCPLPEYDSEDEAPIYIPKAPDAAFRNLSNQRQRAGVESISFGENSGERHSQSGNRNNLQS